MLLLALVVTASHHNQPPLAPLTFLSVLVKSFGSVIVLVFPSSLTVWFSLLTPGSSLNFVRSLVNLILLLSLITKDSAPS
jgi:uncharacterized protein YqhQ